MAVGDTEPLKALDTEFSLPGVVDTWAERLLPLKSSRDDPGTPTVDLPDTNPPDISAILTPVSEMAVLMTESGAVADMLMPAPSSAGSNDGTGCVSAGGVVTGGPLEPSICWLTDPPITKREGMSRLTVPIIPGKTMNEASPINGWTCTAPSIT